MLFHSAIVESGSDMELFRGTYSMYVTPALASCRKKQTMQGIVYHLYHGIYSACFASLASLASSRV